MHGYKLIKIIENEAILEGFKSPEVRKKIKTRKISPLGFQCVAISIEGYFEILNFYGVHSQIWLNLLGWSPFSLPLPMDDQQLDDYIKKILLKKQLIRADLYDPRSSTQFSDQVNPL